MATVNDTNNATYIYAHAFYTLLDGQAKEEEITVAGEIVTVRVWRGKLSELFDSLSISNKYYTSIRRILIEYDCVQYLERGTRGYESVLVLNHAPPPIEKISPADLTSSAGDATLVAVAERLTSAERKLAILEGLRDQLGGINIAEVLQDMERRVSQLERETGGKQIGETETKAG